MSLLYQENRQVYINVNGGHQSDNNNIRKL